MASGRLSAASQVLQTYNAELVTAISAGNLLSLTLKLYGGGLIESETKDNVDLLVYTPHQKASIVVSAVERKVEADPSLFHQFITLLQSEGDGTLKLLGNKIQETKFNGKLIYKNTSATERREGTFRNYGPARLLRGRATCRY